LSRECRGLSRFVTFSTLFFSSMASVWPDLPAFSPLGPVVVLPYRDKARAAVPLAIRERVGERVDGRPFPKSPRIARMSADGAAAAAVPRPTFPFIFLSPSFCHSSFMAHSSRPIAPSFSAHYTTTLISCQHVLLCVPPPSPQLPSGQRFRCLDICLQIARPVSPVGGGGRL